MPGLKDASTAMLMPHLPLTIIMTVHNGMPYLRESIRAILAQDAPGFCFHVVENSSADGSGSFLDSVTAKHSGQPEITVERLPVNIGRTAALNLALDAVKTEFAAVVDADDVPLPGKVSRQMALFKEHPGLDLCGSGVKYIDVNGAILCEERCPATHEDLLEALVVRNPFARSSCMFRVSAAREAGGFDSRFPFSQTEALWVAMLARSSRALAVPEPLTRVRVHPGQGSGQIAMLRVRPRDTHRLARAMLAIRGLGPAQRQAALVRSAGALFYLKRYGQALAELWRAFRESPMLLPFNPLIWRRLRIERQRRKELLRRH